MTAAILLLVNGAFAWIVWPPFYRRTARDSRARDAQRKATRYLKVHAILIGSALLLATISLVIGVLALLRVTN